MTAVAGERLFGIEYRFPYPAPAWAPEYSRWFAGTARFSARCMEVRVPKKILRLRSVTADAQTRPAITLAAERELAWQRSFRRNRGPGPWRLKLWSKREDSQDRQITDPLD
jgi:hypothetical protein